MNQAETTIVLRYRTWEDAQGYWIESWPEPGQNFPDYPDSVRSCHPTREARDRLISAPARYYILVPDRKGARQ